MEEVWRYIDDHAEEFIEVVRHLCRTPSMSATGEGVLEMADLVESLAQEAGFAVRRASGRRFPILMGESGSGRRTLGFYNHYDVQPPEPLEEWLSPPFAAEVRDGRLWGRGVADNKGNIAARLCAFTAYRAVRGPLPLRVQWVLEGEEEVGSPGLWQFAEENRDWLRQANGFIWESGYNQDNRLVAYLGLKGMLYVELIADEERVDQHSMYGSVVPNPLWKLTHAVASLKDADGNITMDGFMDDVAAPSEAQRALLDALVPTEMDVLRMTGARTFIGGLTGKPLVERHLFAPTCNIAGWSGGYGGQGQKTVLPARGMVKLDFRLVPGQSPDRVAQLLREHLDRRGFTDVEIRVLSRGFPWATPPESEIVQSVRLVAAQLWEGEPILYPILAASGPMYALCGRHGIPATAGPGTGHPEMRMHGPNENIYVSDYIRAIKGVASLLEVYAATD